MIIYKATNLINNKIYIGQTINSLEYRKSQHVRDSENEHRRKTVYFHNAIHKYGAENFEFAQIDSASSQEELDEKEQYWINYYKSSDRNYGYNLDSGGKSGGCKNELTRERIGAATRDRWDNPVLADKMLNGLRKGTEAMKLKAEDNYVDFICQVCGEHKKLKLWEAKNRKTCSIKCSRKLIKDKNDEHLHNLRKMQDKEICAQREDIKNFILSWAKNNKDIIQSCPSNKISAMLSPMLELIYNNFNIKDMRTITICLGTNSRKEFLSLLKDYTSI